MPILNHSFVSLKNYGISQNFLLSLLKSAVDSLIFKQNSSEKISMSCFIIAIQVSVSFCAQAMNFNNIRVLRIGEAMIPTGKLSIPANLQPPKMLQVVQ